MISSLRNNIQLIVYDCDGVLTDNRVLVSEDGKEASFFHRGDGLAISGIKNKLKIRQLILSTETNPIVIKRSKKLNIEVINSVCDKATTLRSYCNNNDIPLDRVLYIGNDINDFEIMSIVGFKGCPSDAEPEIIAISDWVSTKSGGYGVVRELYRILCDDSYSNSA